MPSPPPAPATIRSSLACRAVGVGVGFGVLGARRGTRPPRDTSWDTPAS